MRAFLYGGFQDGHRVSEVCTDINLGDRSIYWALSSGLVRAGLEVDFVLPDEKDRIGSLDEGDLLVIGGGGLFEGYLLDPQVIRKSPAKKIVVGAGVNWSRKMPPAALFGIQLQAQEALAGIPVVMVRDLQTKAFLRIDSAAVFPDLAWALWKPSEPKKDGAAAVVSAEIRERSDETPIKLNLIHRPDLAMASGWEDFRPFKTVRTDSYHGMIFSLMAGATAEVTLQNVKQESFLLSYADRLTVIPNADGAVSVTCRDPEWFFRQAQESIRRVVRWAGYP